MSSAFSALYPSSSSTGNILVPQNRRVWVDGVNGSDITGNGSFANPYATVESAMSTITTATALTPWTIYMLNGSNNALSSSFVFKSNVRIICLDAFPLTLSRADNKEILNDGTSGTYVFQNISFGTGCKFTSTLGYSVIFKDCTFSSVPGAYNIACAPDISGSLAGKYFLIDAPMDSYYHYYTVNGAGTDPAIAGRKKLTTDLTTNDSAATIASKTNTSLGNSIQIRPSAHDFSISTSGAPSGSFRIIATTGVDAYSVTDVNTGFTVSTVTQGRGVQILGNSQTVRATATFQNVNAAGGSIYMKFVTATGSNMFLNAVALDGGAGTSASSTFSLFGDYATLQTQGFFQIKGFAQVIKRGNSGFGSNPIFAPIRLLNRQGGLPVFNGDSFDPTGIGKFTGSIIAGSSIMTIVSGGTKANTFLVGIPLFGEGIGANTFVGDSTGLASNQLQMIDENGIPKNALETKSSVLFAQRRVVFQDGCQQSQLVRNPDATVIPYAPWFTSEWPTISPNNIGQALDALSTRNLTKESYPVSSGDVTNQYVQLSNLYRSGSIIAFLRSASTPTVLKAGFDGASKEYVQTTYTDANGITLTKLTFSTNWATGGGNEIVASDILEIQGLTQIDNF